MLSFSKLFYATNTLTVNKTSSFKSRVRFSMSSVATSQRIESLLKFVGSLPTKQRKSKEKFYLTTAIFYTNGKPHIGHLYEAVTSDIICRYHRIYGRDVFFLTGTDEHGQKVAKTAENANLKPKELCDINVKEFKKLTSLFNISNNYFIRTTDKYHYKLASEMFNLSLKNGDIYLGKYCGYYNPREECYITDNEAKKTNFIDPISLKPYEKHSEESYFFKQSKYKNRLLNDIKTNKFVILPESARSNILERLEDELRDLCVSRSTLKWGIPVPNNNKHVLYVWFDALSNYLSGIDYFNLNEKNKNKNLHEYWPANVHIIGKDISWFHCVIWPCMLYSCNIPLPKSVFCHGFVNDKNGNKMSKSLGNVIDPFELLNIHSVDSIRYFIATQGIFGEDIKWDNKQLKNRHDAELTNQFGNLVNRALKLCSKYNNSLIPDCNESDIECVFDVNILKNKIDLLFKDFNINNSSEEIMNRVRLCNDWLHKKQPWKEVNNNIRLCIIRTSLECIYILSHFLFPFIPNSCNTVFKYLNSKHININKLNNNFCNLKSNTKIINDGVLFKQHHKKHLKKLKNINKPYLASFKFVIGKIEDIKIHPKNKNSYVSSININENKNRTIVSGLVNYCKKEELLNSYVIVFSNLKSSNFQGIKSHGMILCSTNKIDNKTIIAPIRPSNNNCIIGERLNWSKQNLFDWTCDDNIKIKSKKNNSIWETKIYPLLKTNKQGQMCYDNKPFIISNAKLICSVKNGQIC